MNTRKYFSWSEVEGLGATIQAAIALDEFTLTELQHAVERLVERRLDKRNFRAALRRDEIVIATGKERRGPHRPAKLYKFAPIDWQPR